jgi:HK97 family phage major capsid protein
VCRAALNGDGTGEEFEGLDSTSGVLTVAYATNLITTTRKAVTKLEQQGSTGTGWCLNPADWEAIELAATSIGSLLMAEAGQRTPVKTAGRRLWGSPVATSVACPAGVGWYADWEVSTKLFVRDEAVIDWSEALYSPDRFGEGDGGTLFEANQIVVRAEGRFGFGVLRPSGIVKVDLTA